MVEVFIYVLFLIAARPFRHGMLTQRLHILITLLPINEIKCYLTSRFPIRPVDPFSVFLQDYQLSQILLFPHGADFVL